MLAKINYTGKVEHVTMQISFNLLKMLIGCRSLFAPYQPHCIYFFHQGKLQGPYS